MKKYLSFISILILLMNFSGCKTVNSNETETTQSVISEEQRDAYYNTFENFEKTFTIVKAETKNYRIKTSEQYAGNVYEIYDHYGHLLDKGYHGWRGSFDISQNDEIIILEYGYGGTNVHPQYRFYDPEKGLASRYFEGPVAYYGRLVAYFCIGEDTAELIVQDIFDTDKTYVAFRGKFDKFILMKIQEISFADDGAKVVIKHCETNNESNIIVESFLLH